MEFTQIGFTRKTHGVKGELKVFIEEPYEDLFLEQDRIFLEIRGVKQPFFIEEVRGLGDLIVRFEDVKVREEAIPLQSKGIFLPAGEVPEVVESGEEGLAYAHITGFRVIDKTLGELGTVEEVLDMPQQEMAVLQHQGREVLIPLNEHFVLSVNEKEKTVLVDLPEGLLSL